MLRLELVGNTQKEVIYNYFPEQGKEYGTVSMNKDTGEFSVVKISANDEFRTYLSHAVSKIKKYSAENIFLEHDVVAWC